MKIAKLTMASAIVSLLAASQALAQSTGAYGLRQPAQQTAYAYDAYYDQDPPATSPSDAPAAAAAPAAADESGCCEKADACQEEAACDECKPCCGNFGDLFKCADCDSCFWFGPSEPWNMVDESVAWMDIGGWQQGGYTNNFDGTFNNHPDRFNLNQSWLFLGRAADGAKGFDVGFRTDMLYGVDAQNTQAFGNNPGRYDYLNGWDHGIYGWALPQLYGEVAMGDLTVKMGHFFTLAGYEVVPAPGNFFYSHAFTMNYMEPFTHTGVLASYKASDNVTLHGGWTLGWDTGFDRINDGSNFLGGGTLTIVDGWTLTYITEVGNLGFIGDGYGHSIVMSGQLTEKMQWVVLSDYLHASIGGFEGVSLVNYLFYKLTDCWSLGGRVEWWKRDGVSINEVTFGLNYKPHANWWIRPEMRYNWSPADGLTAISPQFDNDTWIFGIDTYFTY